MHAKLIWGKVKAVRWGSLRPLLLVLLFWFLPVLVFSRENYRDLEYPETWFVLFVVLAFGLALWGVVWMMLRDAFKSAVIAAILAYPLNYFYDLDTFISSNAPAWILSWQPAYVLVLVVLLLLLWIGRKTKPNRFVQFTNYLLIVGLLIFLYNAVSIGDKVRGDTNLSVSAVDRDLEGLRVSDAAQKPDIYYLVFDRYTGTIGLSESYGFDNSPFLNQLKERGFYVASQSYSNYPITPFSLASSLNGNHLEVSGNAKTASSREPLRQLIRNATVPKVLQENGYHFINMGSWWGPTATSTNADENPRYAYQIPVFGKKIQLNYVSATYFRKTALFDLARSVPGSRLSIWTDQRPIFLDQMDSLVSYAERRDRQPKFVFGHMLAPHYPYVFNKGGGMNFRKGLSKKEVYLEQLQFVNSRILRTVDALLNANPKNPPVIVLTADEGEHPKEYFTDSDDAQLRQKTNILAAYYFPGQRYRGLYPEMTSVNALRSVLNVNLGANLPLLPDRTYTSRTRSQEYDLIDITNRIRRSPGPRGSAIGE